jgi:tRNA(Ile)-lysidine synthase
VSSNWSTALTIPGAAMLPGGRSIVAARMESVELGSPFPGGLECATLDAHRLREPLTVRFRRPGDRIRPLGMPGRKKLQDVFVDRKLPKNQRDDVPIVVDADERILWVAGHIVADVASMTPATTSVLLLQYRKC